MRRLLAALAALLCPTLACATPGFAAVVVHVTDGDTVWVRPATGGASVQVRLQGLDAPETCQRWGPQARDALASRLLRQPVRVRALGRDDYQRTLARLDWQGHDVGAWLVVNGLAWSYRYRGQAGPYHALQVQARQARRGLWSDPRPQEPRSFRRQHGPCLPAEHR